MKTQHSLEGQVKQHCGNRACWLARDLNTKLWFVPPAASARSALRLRATTLTRIRFSGRSTPVSSQRTSECCRQALVQVTAASLNFPLPTPSRISSRTGTGLFTPFLPLYPHTTTTSTTRPRVTEPYHTETLKQATCQHSL